LPFVILYHKEIGTKAALIILVKLAKGVNFTNILQAAFFYESVSASFSLITVCVCDFLSKENCNKS